MFSVKPAAGHDQRGPGVLQPAQHPGAGEDEQHRHEAGHGPAQVVHGKVLHLAAGAHQVQERPGGQEPGDGQDDPEQQRQPDAVAPGGEGLGQLAVADGPRHRRGGGVGEEHHQAHGRVQHRRRQPDAGQLGHAEMAHDGRIREQEQRLGDQRAEGRHGQAQDLPALPCGRRRGGDQRRRQVARINPSGPPNRPRASY